MAYGQYHEIPYNSKVEERILGPFSFSKLKWLIPGVILSYQFAKFIPVLPLDSLIISRIHWLMPLLISFVFAYFKDKKTNLSLFQLIKMKRSIKRRKRAFYYRRSNMPRWEEFE